MTYSRFKNKLNSVIKKQPKRGSPTVEESVGHIPISQMFEELDACMNLASQMAEDYTAFRNGGVRNKIVSVQVALLSIKKYTTLYRRYLSYMREQIRPHEDYSRINFGRFKRALYREDTAEAKDIAEKMGFNYDDFSMQKYTKRHKKAKVFALTKKEIDDIFYGNKYKYPIIKGKRVMAHVCVSKIDKSISFLRRPNESLNKRTAYIVHGCVCPQDWVVDDPSKLKVVNIAQFLDGEKFQIHRITKSTMKVSRKKQPDDTYVEEKDTVLSEINRSKVGASVKINV